MKSRKPACYNTVVFIQTKRSFNNAAVRSPEDLDLLIFYGILHVYIRLALFS